jgi:hypothetical protein
MERSSAIWKIIPSIRMERTFIVYCFSDVKAVAGRDRTDA